MYEDRERLISESVADRITEKLPQEKLGVVIEEPPYLNAESFATALAEETDYDIGLALVGIDEADIENLQEILSESRVRVTDEVSVAVKWRNATETEFRWNGRKTPERTVALVRGDHAKVGSLHRITSVPLGEITEEITEKMRSLPEFRDNEVAQEVWRTLGEEMSDKFDIPTVADYAVSTIKESSQLSLEALGSELYRLGLFRDSGINSADEVESRLKNNRELVLKVSFISKSDRRQLTRTDEVGEAVEKLRRFERTGDKQILSTIEYEDVVEVFSSTGSSNVSKRKTTRNAESTSVSDFLEGDESNVREAVQSFADKYSDAVEKGENKVYLDYSEDLRIRRDVDDDRHHFIDRFTRENRFGGFLKGAEDREEAVNKPGVHEIEYLNPFDDESTFGKLRDFSERRGELTELVEAVDRYLESRNGLLDYLPQLLELPMMTLLGDEEIREKVGEYLDEYQQAQKEIDRSFRDFEDIGTSQAHEFLSEFLLLDTIVLETDGGREMILSPLHPLHIWKYYELADEATRNRDSLTQKEREFLVDAVQNQPHVLRSIHAGGHRELRETEYLVQSDELGKLPVYTQTLDATGDNSDAWGYLLEKFTSAYPPSGKNLKISVVDPIHPSTVLKTIADMEENGELEGASVDFVFVKSDKKSILEGATTADEEDITRVFGPDDRSGNFDVLVREYGSYEEYFEDVEEDPRHLILVNDESESYVDQFERRMDTDIHPLYVPKEFDYKPFDDEITITPSKEGELFSEYQTLLNNLHRQRQDIHTEEIYELEIGQESVDGLLQSSVWVCLSTPPMNADQFWSEDLISRERRGERDYAIYSRDLDYFARALRRLISEYRVAPEDADILELARSIADTHQSGLLRLITEEVIGGQGSHNLKGILGSIIAVRWLEENIPEPKMIFSIDDPRTRRWLNFGDSNRRSDFLAVYLDDGELAIDVIEVKATDDHEMSFSIETKDSQKMVEGSAVEQVFESTETIRGLFTEEEDITTAPRKEVLHEQIYYELISSDKDMDKAEWSDKINSVFRGDGTLSVNPRIVSVELTNESVSTEEINAITKEAKSVEIDRIPRESVIRLIVNDIDKKEPEFEDDEETTVRDEDEPSQSGGSDSDSDSAPVSSEDGEGGSSGEYGDIEEYTESVDRLKRVLDEFGVSVREIDPDLVEIGPNIIRYKVLLSPGEKQSKMENRTADLAREMALENEPIIHRIPDTQYIAVDVPRSDRQTVHLTDHLGQLEEVDNEVGNLPFVAGVKPSGDAHIADLTDAPHILVGGTTGSGKTVFLYSLLTCILETHGTSDVDLAIIDPKLTNFMFFEGLPNLVNGDVITDADEAYDLFEWIVNEEITRRKEVLKESSSVDIVDHNSRAENDKMNPIVVAVDEYADLLDAAGDRDDELETNVRRIAQIARSVGIHLVISTQKPSSEIINTDLRSNLDMRVGFRVPNASDSRVILDESGAETLGGDGDMLFKEGPDTTRLQGTLIEPDGLRDIIGKYS
jgi:hypothetical protein